ncbi:MAG: VOC family protein [Reinekea sp.]|nr:VOC family protein [Reinekea sp.]MDX1475389.1 VOC family protein [Reinekea sp.]
MNIEHTNMTVRNIDATTRFLRAVYPDIKIRGKGPRQNGGIWQHVGTQTHYIALQQDPEPSVSSRRDYYDLGINHVGFVVEDLAVITQRLLALGYRKNDMGVENEGRHSEYFVDDSGIEWELVEYKSDDPSVRNDYTQ